MDFNAFDAAMGAFVLPPVIALINQVRWASQVRAVIALAVCAVYALVIAIIRGPVDFTDWRDTLLTVAGAAFALHGLFWRPSGIAGSLEAVGGGGAPGRTIGGTAVDTGPA